MTAGVLRWLHSSVAPSFSLTVALRLNSTIRDWQRHRQNGELFMRVLLEGLSRDGGTLNGRVLS